MRPPVILCAFSNSGDAYLSQLEKEKEAISDALRERQGKGHLLLDTDPRTIKKLRDRLLLYQPQVEIIHYAGHASGSQLLMEDATVYGAGLLQSVRLQKNLQLVFLNGCSTQEQVNQLLDAGVRAVIATSVDIGDDTATRFAEDFYQKLAGGHTIDEAFKLATEVVTAKNNATLNTEEHQERGIARTIKAPNTGPVWGLYLHKNHQDAASHRLSEKSFYELHIKSQIDSNFNTSEDAILASLYNVLMTFSDELPMFEDLEKKYGEQWDPKRFDVREVKNAIINSLPSPIAEQVRKLLVTEDEPLASERLRFLINTYSVMADLLLFIMFSQLWEALVQGKVPVLEDRLKEQINAFFLLDQQDRQAYDVIPLVRLIHDKLKAHDVPLFVSEMSHLADLMDERDSEFFGAYLHITRIKSKYRDLAIMEELDDRECRDDCQKAEASLCIMFKELGFCARYKFATIKNIYINKKKNQPAVYQHKMVKLDYVLVGFTDKMEDFENFTDSNSVVIYKIEDKKLSAFNLYPFVIDMNALISEKLSKIYFFYNYDKNTSATTCTYNFIKNINEKKDRLQIPALPSFLRSKTDLKISQEELETIGPDILQSVEGFISYFKS
ncbi:CHAT domain-containing protein [Dyadobacter fermentans]|uniref:CHAT domain-containing protein n=1 Tax=Dyadobacter fermentans TaxID=94254 RepID=UPI001CBDA249|nr:CHAT domain-containing protein [Dyadobacter fermentans]MBZ1361457.1 CHAT domain-containing protein [Dyadobacter fermentans]